MRLFVSAAGAAGFAPRRVSPYNLMRGASRMRRCYFNAKATTPLLPEVREAMRPFWMEDFGNASSIHLQGQKARRAVDNARETLARFFHCRGAEVVFNSGGTEG